MHVQLASLEDLDEIYWLQSEWYAAHLIEDKHVFAAIIEQGFSLVCVLNKKIIGYILCHASLGTNTMHPLDEPPGFIKEPGAYFIHDLLIDPEHRAKGIGSMLVKELMKKLGENNDFHIVSVENTTSFWKRFGFVEDQAITPGYGKDARHMCHAKHLHGRGIGP